MTRRPEATLIASRAPYATFNNVIDTHLPDDATTDARIREVLASFAPDSLPGHVVGWPDDHARRSRPSTPAPGSHS